MFQHKWAGLLLIAISSFIFVLGISCIIYTVAQAENISLISRVWSSFRNDSGNNKPTLVSVKKLSVEDSLSSANNTLAVITNPNDNHITACVRGKISAINTKWSYYSTIYCFADIPPYSTEQHTLPIVDPQNTIIDKCFDQDKFVDEYMAYQNALSEWSAKVEDYKSKVSQSDAYAQAIKILSNRKPQPPTKVFSWKSCSFELVDAFDNTPNKR